MVGERHCQICRLGPSARKRTIVADGARDNAGEVPGAFGRGALEVLLQYTHKPASHRILLLGSSVESMPRRTFDAEDILGNQGSLVSPSSQTWTRI
jgi:hypothetical protein